MSFDIKTRKGQITIAVGVILIALVGWYFLGGNDGGGNVGDSMTSLTEISSDPVEVIIGRELLAALDKMKSVKLDVSFFDNSVYKTLEDTTVEIPKQPIGRRNPFAPLSPSSETPVSKNNP